MTDNQLDAILAVFQKRMQRVTDEYLRRMGRQIREIGEIIPSAQTRLVQMRKVDMNLKYIQNAIAREAEKSIGDIQVIFKAIAAENIRFAEAYFGGKLPKTFLNQLINAQLKATANELVNLSQTTIESTLYRDAVDESIQAVQVGVEDYNSAIRRAVQKAAESGVRFRSASPSVEYPNGRTKRLDSAVRQNVLDGIRKLNQENMKAIGEAFGADGVELTAHMMCADDHLPYQGKQFSNAEFGEIQKKLSRPFGMWNCRHSWSPILMGISEPAYTDAELERFRQNSTEKIEIDGVTKTRYQWTQEQRKIETAIRYQQDVATAAKATGDTVLKRNAKKTIAALNDYYAKIVDVAGVPDKPDRKGTNYGKGFKYPSLSPGNIAERLKNVQKSGMIYMDGYRRRDLSPNRGAFKELLEPMTLDNVKKVLRQMGLYDKKITYEIDANDSLIGTGFFAYTTPDGKKITFYPDSFSTRKQLVVTCGHEHIHVNQTRERGIALDSVELNRRENEAYAAEEQIWEDYKKRVYYKE